MISPEEQEAWAAMSRPATTSVPAADDRIEKLTRQVDNLTAAYAMVRGLAMIQLDGQVPAQFVRDRVAKADLLVGLLGRAERALLASQEK